VDPPKDGSDTVFKAEALSTRRGEFEVINLCVLCAYAVNISSQETRNNQKIKTSHGFATGTVSLPSKGGEKTTKATAGSPAVLTK
jgi:hypothetical protein